MHQYLILLFWKNYEMLIDIGLKFRIKLQKSQTKYVIPFDFPSEPFWNEFKCIALSPAMNSNDEHDFKSILIKKITFEEVE